MNPIDPLQLQRLIDGECSSDEARQMLLTVQQSSKHATQIATSLCSDRVWQQMFKSEFEAGSVAARLPAIEFESGNHPLSDPAWTTDTDIKRTVVNQSRNSARPNWLVIAASVLVAAMLGYGAGQNFSILTPDSNLVTNGLTASHPVSEPNFKSDSDSDSDAIAAVNSQITPVSLPADYRLQLPDDTRSKLAGEVPLYGLQSAEQWSQVNRRAQDSFQLSPEAIRQLQANGYRVRRQTNYLAGSLEDGRSFIVPIRSIHFSHGQ